MTNTIKGFIMASRPKTLPLAASVVLVSGVSARYYDVFNPNLFLLLLFTTLLLQILSNFANDYGDYKKGTDRLANRSDRALAAGILSPKQVLIATIITALLAFFSGLALLYFSFGSLNSQGFIFMLVIGLLAIAAAITYTVGSHAYGYKALGDLFVWVFFGPVAIWGALYLYHSQVGSSIILEQPTFALAAALCSGLIPVCVLTLNNLRDIKKDRESDKLTIPVLLGFNATKIYYTVLMLMAMAAYAVMAWKLYEPKRIILPMLALFSLIVAFKRIKKMASFSVATTSEEMNAELRNTSLTALLISLSLWI